MTVNINDEWELINAINESPFIPLWGSGIRQLSQALVDAAEEVGEGLQERLDDLRMLRLRVLRKRFCAPPIVSIRDLSFFHSAIH